MYQFPSTDPTVTIVLLVNLATILTGATDQNFDEAYYKSLVPGYSYGYLQTSQTDKFYPSRSQLECAIIALNSQSEFFSYNKVSQVCKNYSPKNIMTVINMLDSNEISYYKSSEWIKAYALSMGANSLIYNSILNIGSPSTWNVDKCNGDYCPNFFRHPILDIWNKLPIDQVKLVLYKNQTAVVTMVFNGRNTTLENWFSDKNLESSPWDDLATSSKNSFSMVGVVSVRRFYVSAFHKGCPGDTGWLCINEKFLACAWERSSYFPSILYSNTKSKTIWRNGYGTADSMAIFIRMKPN
ncbi:uncharacterized protein LOC106873068 [Octopus bimaculoides]|nr:uncharacterized protein LOC106873068 [Octopus bimaculoides]XP_052833757.1 uncharacterized protein LOC106873068 [Octopus bimaculoides]